jgi:hypothetical protein
MFSIFNLDVTKEHTLTITNHPGHSSSTVTGSVSGVVGFLILALIITTFIIQRRCTIESKRLQTEISPFDLQAEGEHSVQHREGFDLHEKGEHGVHYTERFCQVFEERSRKTRLLLKN